MSNLECGWVSGEHLLEKWDISEFEFMLLIIPDLTAYDKNFKIWGLLSHSKGILTLNNKQICATLRNLLFKVDEVLKIEKEYWLIDESGNKTNDYFAILYTIIRGQKRPDLKIYSDEEYVKDLLDKFTRAKACILFQDESETPKLISMPRAGRIDFFKEPGDDLHFEIDDNDKLCLVFKKNEGAEDKGNNYLPEHTPKYEYFTRLIHYACKGIENDAIRSLKIEYLNEDQSIFAKRNIQILKIMVKEAHYLKKELEDKAADDNDIDSSIIGYLYIRLIELIKFFQETFEPFLQISTQDISEITSELHYDIALHEVYKKVMEAFYDNLGCEVKILEGNTVSRGKDFFKNKLMNKEWCESIAAKSKQVGFIGVRQLASLMATDEIYLSDSNGLILADLHKRVTEIPTL